MGKRNERGESVADVARRDGARQAEEASCWTWEDLSAFARGDRARGDGKSDPDPESIRIVVECERISALGRIPFIDIPRGGAPRVCSHEPGEDVEAARERSRAELDRPLSGLAVEAREDGEPNPRSEDQADGARLHAKWRAFFEISDLLRSHGVRALPRLPTAPSRGSSTLLTAWSPRTGRSGP